MINSKWLLIVLGVINVLKEKSKVKSLDNDGWTEILCGIIKDFFDVKIIE